MDGSSLIMMTLTGFRVEDSLVALEQDHHLITREAPKSVCTIKELDILILTPWYHLNSCCSYCNQRFVIHWIIVLHWRHQKPVQIDV